MSVDKPLEVVRSPKKCRENIEDCTAGFTRDRGQKKQQDGRRNYQRTKCGVVWGS